MTITMTLEEYELLKAQASKPDKGMEELEKWNSFLDSLDADPSPMLKAWGDSQGGGYGSAIFTSYKQFKR